MIIHQNELSEKLKILKSISSAKLGDDLSGVLLKDKMLIANNFKTAIVVPLTDCEEAINCIIPPTAIDFIISLPEGNVEITEKDKQLIIKCGKIKSKFNTYDTDLFPETNTSKPDENKLLIDIKTVDLEKAVKQVMYACAKPNSSKPVHEGLLFDGDGIYLNIVACDGYRVAWNKLDNTNEFKMVLDKEALNKAFSIADDNICIYSNDSKSIVIEAGEYLINSRLYLAEQFMDYSATVPKTFKTVFNVERSQILSCFNRIGLCVSDKKKYPAELNYQDDTLDISVKDPMVDIHETLSLQPITSNEPTRIGINIEFMKDALKSVTSESIMFCMNGGLNPIIIQDDKFTQVLMPMRLKG